MVFHCSNPTCSATVDLPGALVDRAALATALDSVGWAYHLRRGGMDWVLICARCVRDGFEPPTW